MKRIFASRKTLLFTAGVFLLCLAFMFLKNSWGRPATDGKVSELVLIIGTTNIGIPYLLVEGLMPLFGLILPFITTDAVSRDYQERTHELLMTSTISTPAYIWGRYLSSLFICLSLAVILLFTTVIGSWLLHIISQYPFPNIQLLFSVWLIAVIPAVIVTATISFILGTLFPKYTNVMKLISVSLWIGLLFTVDATDRGATWFTYWNPTGYGIVRTNVNNFLSQYNNVISHTTIGANPMKIALQLQQQMPILSPWVIPHIALIVFCFVGIAIIAKGFDRFRSVLE